MGADAATALRGLGRLLALTHVWPQLELLTRQPALLTVVLHQGRRALSDGLGLGFDADAPRLGWPHSRPSSGLPTGLHMPPPRKALWQINLLEPS